MLMLQKTVTSWFIFLSCPVMAHNPSDLKTGTFQFYDFVIDFLFRTNWLGKQRKLVKSYKSSSRKYINRQNVISLFSK
jgi:hypothetical protein